MFMPMPMSTSMPAEKTSTVSGQTTTTYAPCSREKALRVSPVSSGTSRSTAWSRTSIA